MLDVEFETYIFARNWKEVLKNMDLFFENMLMRSCNTKNFCKGSLLSCR